MSIHEDNIWAAENAMIENETTEGAQDSKKDGADGKSESGGGGWANDHSGWGVQKKEKKSNWKLVMMRKIMAITFRFSDRCSCARFMFNDKNKQVEHGDGSVSTRIRLCADCVALNIEANDAVAKFYEAKKFQKKE